MSVRLMDQVWKHCTAKAPAKYVLLYIADRARDDGTGAYPSVPTIARVTRLGVRTVNRALVDLEGDGYLVIIREQGKANRYIVRPTPAALTEVPPLPESHQPLPLSHTTPARESPTPAALAPEPLEPPREPLQPQVVVVYGELYGAAPSTRKQAWLESMQKKWGPTRVVAALRTESAKDPNPRSICGRMEAGLKTGDLLNRYAPASTPVPDEAATVQGREPTATA